MPTATYIALLRAVNLGPHNKVAMADLRELLADLGLEDPRTVLQTGNLVFGSGASGAEELERLLEEEAKARLGLDTDVLVRTAEEWREVIEGNPFPGEAESDPGHLLVFCLKAAPEPGAVKALQEAIRGREQVRARGRHAYVTYPDGIGRSRLTIAKIEKHLGTRGTGRNWNTVLKLQALAESS